MKSDVPESDVVVDVFACSGDGDVEVGRVGGLLEGDAVGDGGVWRCVVVLSSIGGWKRVVKSGGCGEQKRGDEDD